MLGIAALILVKEAGIPVPVPGDLIVIGAGAAAGCGQLDPPVALALIVAASIAGGIVQYGLLRSVARPTMLRLLRRLGGAERVERETDRLQRGGARSVAIARSTPGVRVVAIAASALAAVPAPAFIAGLAVGNALFIAAHFALGYLLGERVVAVAGGILGPLAVAGVALALVGAAGWVVLRRRQGTTTEALTTAVSWTDACCPACLTLAAVDLRH